MSNTTTNTAAPTITLKARCIAACRVLKDRMATAWNKTMAGFTVAMGYAKAAAIMAVMGVLLGAAIGGIVRANNAERFLGAAIGGLVRADAAARKADAAARKAEAEAQDAKEALAAALAPKPTFLQKVYSYTAGPVVSFDRGAAARMGLTRSAGIGE